MQYNTIIILKQDDTVRRQKERKKGPTKPNQKKHKDGTRASASGNRKGQKKACN